MKSPYIGDLVPNEVVTAQFLVVSKEIRQKKTGDPYLTLQLADRTGELEAKMWDNVAEVMNAFERDHFVRVKGLVQVFQNRAQFTIHRLRRLEDHEVDFADYFPCSERNLDEMFAELLGIVSGIQNPHLKALLEAVLGDAEIVRLFKIAPAAKTIHHACRGGLLEHVLSICSLCRMCAAHYKELDLDLTLTGAILHDIGKVEELSFARSFGYTTQGQLLGHIVIGLRTLGTFFDRIPSFPRKLRILVEHLIVSHHGELEFGSPKVPVFAEALLLHHLDNLDSKMDAMRSALRRDRLVDGEFTSWVGSLERTLLKKDRFLADAPASAAPPEPPAFHMPAAQSVSSAPVRSVAPAPLSIPSEPAPGRPVHPASGHSADHLDTDSRQSNGHLRPENRPAAPTVFGEKLQAVLGPRK